MAGLGNNVHTHTPWKLKILGWSLEDLGDGGFRSRWREQLTAAITEEQVALQQQWSICSRSRWSLVGSQWTQATTDRVDCCAAAIVVLYVWRWRDVNYHCYNVVCVKMKTMHMQLVKLGFAILFIFTYLTFLTNSIELNMKSNSIQTWFFFIRSNHLPISSFYFGSSWIQTEFKTKRVIRLNPFNPIPTPTSNWG